MISMRPRFLTCKRTDSPASTFLPSTETGDVILPIFCGGELDSRELLHIEEAYCRWCFGTAGGTALNGHVRGDGTAAAAATAEALSVFREKKMDESNLSAVPSKLHPFPGHIFNRFKPPSKSRMSPGANQCTQARLSGEGVSRVLFTHTRANLLGSDCSPEVTRRQGRHANQPPRFDVASEAAIIDVTPGGIGGRQITKWAGWTADQVEPVRVTIKRCVESGLVAVPTQTWISTESATEEICSIRNSRVKTVTFYEQYRTCDHE